MDARPASLVATVLATALAATTAAAQPFDHLQCFKIKDPLPRANAAADLVPEQSPPFNVAPGCKIKLPAKYFCIDVAKENLQPPAALDINDADTHDFFCYRIACRKDPSAPRGGMPLDAEDQFGRRTVLIKRSPYFCAPARKVVPTPSVTPTPLTGVPCGQLPPDQCGQGDCGPISDCVVGVGGFCRCEPPTPTPNTPVPTRTRTPGPCTVAQAPCSCDAQGQCVGVPCGGFSSCQMVGPAGAAICECEPPVPTKTATPTPQITP